MKNYFLKYELRFSSKVSILSTSGWSVAIIFTLIGAFISLAKLHFLSFRSLTKNIYSQASLFILLHSLLIAYLHLITRGQRCFLASVTSSNLNLARYYKIDNVTLLQPWLKPSIINRRIPTYSVDRIMWCLHQLSSSVYCNINY